MSRSDNRRRRHIAAFDTECFITRMVADLAQYLDEGEVADILSAIHSPSEYRALLKTKLSEAGCMDGIPRYAALRQLEACASKLPTWGDVGDKFRKERAIGKFLKAERSCARANKRIKHFARYPGRLRPAVRCVLDMAALEIHRALGLVSDSIWYERCGFGPGVTFASNGQKDVGSKLSLDQTVTPKARMLALEVLQSNYPNWAALLATEGVKLEVVQGNRIATAPKTWDIFRVIGIEASLNVFMQKGVCAELEDRAVRMGVYIRSQDHSINCMRTMGSRIATVDLTSASDCVAREAIRLLFPADWYELLDTLRSHYYTLDGGSTWAKYEKFSSMGNATTFPVESILFMGVARACARYAGYTDVITSAIRVYGDDIIVPWEIAGLLIEVLAFLGFGTNSDKTFVFGPFRETCGVDLLEGVDVRPVYLRYVPTKPWEVAGLYNRLLSNRFGFSLHRTLAYLWSLVERPLTGPAYHGYSSLTSNDWCDWYAGKNTEGDAYFWAPHGHTRPVSIKRGQHVTLRYHLQRWSVVRWKTENEYSEGVNYLAFLLGVQDGQSGKVPVIGVTDTVFDGSYDPFVWDFPPVYAEQREPSDRTIRQALRAELGFPLI